MHPSLRSYLPMVDFLADHLGESTEVVLHDLTSLHQSIVAIRNGHISGREEGAPVTDLSLEILEQARHREDSYISGYAGRSAKGHPLRSSTFFIKEPRGELVGLLCINSDFHALSGAFETMGDFVSAMGMAPTQPEVGETLHKDVEDLVDAGLLRLYPCQKDVKLLPKQEKKELVEALGRQGVFKVKGAVGYVARRLEVSVPTVYRYLQGARQD